MQEQAKGSPLTLFYAYADEDEELHEELEKHLSTLQRQGIIAGWHHHKLLPGTDWKQVQDEQFSSAQIILLLISSDFLASDASHSEMERALQRHMVGLSYVIPLLLRPVDWELPSLAHLQALPRNGRPVTMWENRDEAFADIAKNVRLAIKQWNDSSWHQTSQSVIPKSSSLFVFSDPKDLLLVDRIKEDLQLYGITDEKVHIALYLESSDADEQEQMRKAINSASAVILIATPHTRRSREVKEVLQIAEMYQRPLYLFWMQGDFLTEVIPSDYSYLPSINARGERYTQALEDLILALGRQTAFSSSQASSPRKPAPFLKEPRNPYKGLRAFRPEDAQDFFGRDRLIEEMLDKVQQLLAMDQQNQMASHLLTILGPSGSGKSSVVMAGLIPRLKQGGLTGSEQWTYLDPMVPGKSPLEALTLALSPLFPERTLRSIREDLEDNSARGLHLLLAAHVKQSGARVLLVVDQFEELFTQTAIDVERQQFLDILLAAISEPHGPLLGLLTLRADFYDRLFPYPELGRLIKNHQIMVFPMEMADLREVIEKPSQLPDVQLTFEEGLVGDLLFDVRGQVGALPLLQFTLDQLFRYREQQLLTLRAYQQIGGVKGALAQHAESTYQSLPTETHQRLARALFLRLFDPGTVEEEATRRRIPRSELVVVDQEETTRLTKVTDTFIQARLLTSNTITGVPTVEVSHEALIQAWVRLQDWLHEARDDIRLQQIISKDTAEWNRYKQSADRLYRGSQLKEALQWRKANLPSLDEDRFLQASIKERQQASRRTFLIGLIGVAGIAGTSYLVTTLHGGEANSLSQPIQPHTFANTEPVSGVAWSPDGKRIASAAGNVQIWDASNGHHLLTYSRTGPVYSAAWSPDGKRIASCSSDHTVQVWDSNNGRHLLTYKGHTDQVRCVAWSPDGKRIVSGTEDKTVQVWDASSGYLQFTYTGHTDQVMSVAWSPDGKRIASCADDETAQVWDASSGSNLLTYTGHTSYVTSVAWSPDSKCIASGSDDNTAQVWDASSGYLQFTYTGHTDGVNCVAWSLDSKRIASSSNDKSVQVWDASNGSLQFTYAGHTNYVWSLAWSPDGNWIASGSADSTMRVWSANNGSRQFTYTGHTDRVTSVAWSPDGKRIASGSWDNTAQVWVVSSGSRLLTYTGHTYWVNGVAWSPDGKRIVSGSEDKTVQVWDASSGRHLLTHAGLGGSVAWSPDGKRIASGSVDNTVQVWDASNGRHLLTYKGHTRAVQSVAWSPDGKRIASGSYDETVQVWDASSGSRLLTYIGHTGIIDSVAWSPDGKRIASGSVDNTVQVWDASSGIRLLTYKGHTNVVWDAVWSPDGKRIASGSDDTTVQIWDASSGRRLLTYTGHTDVVDSVSWSPDGKHIASGSWDETVQIWHVA